MQCKFLRGSWKATSYPPSSRSTSAQLTIKCLKFMFLLLSKKRQQCEHTEAKNWTKLCGLQQGLLVEMKRRKKKKKKKKVLRARGMFNLFCLFVKTVSVWE